MKNKDDIPRDYARILTVQNQSAFLQAEFGGDAGVNCIRLKRNLKGDFDQVAQHVAQTGTPGMPYTIREIKEACETLKTSEAHRAARRMMRDIDMIEKHGGLPNIYIQVLDERKQAPFSARLHADNASSERCDAWQAGIVLCAYNVAATRLVRDEDVLIRPGEYGSYLRYAMREGATSFAAATGDMLRIALTENDAGVPPLYHAEPDLPPVNHDGTPRMLMLAEFPGND